MKQNGKEKGVVHHVHITGGLWAAYQNIVRMEAVPYQWSVLNDELEGVEKSSAIENFRIAAGESQQEFYGTCFQDSDVAKWIEGLAYLLEWAPDSAWEEKADAVISLMERAQWADGYLNTYFTAADPQGRFTNIRECDELYCFGHLAEAAVAYARATGKTRMLNIVRRYGDLLCQVFGGQEGQIPACDGHPEAELAFVKLYEATGEERYLNQAGFQLDIRGSEPYYYDLEWERRGGESFHPHLKGIRPSLDKGYDQAECLPRKLDHPVGHAVKMCYLLSGMAAYALYRDDAEMLDACRKIFLVIRDRQMYVTGAVGATRHKEAFTKDYHLPNDRAYGETCASVGMVYAMHWLLRCEPRREYADVMERVLYNAFPAGMALDGQSFFYVNPLEVYPSDIAADADYKAVKPVRQKWFWCACCPPNLVRLMTGLGRYLYTEAGDALYVHLFIESQAEVTLGGGQTVSLEQKTEYPWSGDVHLTARCDSPFTLALRIPGWSQNVRLWKNSKKLEVDACQQNGYVFLACTAGETQFHLQLDMEPYTVQAHPAVKADAGKVAVMRGPVVYCAEEADNGPLLHNLVLDPDAGFAVLDKKLFGAPLLAAKRAWRENTGAFEGLYRRYRDAGEPAGLLLVPYALWGNRRKNHQPEEMMVWLRRMIGPGKNAAHRK